MYTLSNWFPALNQLSPSMQAFCSIAGVTLLVCAVVVFIVRRGRKDKNAR
jgi:tellurite resistance protein TehA-like permease